MDGSYVDGRDASDERMMHGSARDPTLHLRPTLLSYLYEQAAGDTYRSTYHALTADPSSLSNLDQDLPNYLQHEV